MTMPRSPRSYNLSFDCDGSSADSSSSRSISSSSSTCPPSPPTYSDAVSTYSFPSRSSTPLPAYASPRKLPTRSPLPSYASPHQPVPLPLGLSPRAHWELDNPYPRSATNPISAALAAQVEREISEREEKRIRAKLEPLLFPAPVKFGAVMKGLVGGGRKERKEEKERRRREADGLSEREKEIAAKMVEEEWKRMEEGC